MMKATLRKVVPFLCLAFLVQSHPIAADEQAMSDNDLSEVAAQSGLSISPNVPGKQMNHLIVLKRVPYNLKEGTSKATGNALYDFTRLGFNITLENVYFDYVTGEMFSNHGNVFLQMGDFYVSLMDIDLKGNIQGDSLFTTNVFPAYDGTTAGKSVLVQEINSSIQIQRMSIDSIRIGGEPGAGNSMGSVFIDNMRVNNVGTIQIK
ncbi:MAG: hypothetical protein PHN98_00385 [Smithellaceae bacterium]|nr:hypothetical protein [Smithellaceae bacterium]